MKRNQKKISLLQAIERAVREKAWKRLALNEQQLSNLKRASDIALAVLAVSGTLAIAIVAPNILTLFASAHQGKRFSTNRKKHARTLVNTLYYLKKNGLIEFERKSPLTWFLELTRLGRKRASNLRIQTVSIPQVKPWDGKWWLVAADIPTKSHRQGADLLRRKLKELGFYSLQRTLWLHKFDPRKEIEFIANYFTVGRFVTVMEVSRLDVKDLAVLRRHFDSKKFTD